MGPECVFPRACPVGATAAAGPAPEDEAAAPVPPPAGAGLDWPWLLLRMGPVVLPFTVPAAGGDGTWPLLR